MGMGSDDIIRRFIRALSASDEVSARQLCTPDGWHARTNSLSQLYRQLRGHGRHLTLRGDGAPRVSESTRGAQHCSVADPDGEPLSTLTLLYDHIPARISGWTRSRVLVERYLAGVVPADMGLHVLVPDADAAATVERLIRALECADSDVETARSPDDVETAGSDAALLAYLHMRIQDGARVIVEGAHHLPVLERIAASVRFESRSGEHESSPLWLYAERDHLGRVRWLTHRTFFDVDALLAH